MDLFKAVYMFDNFHMKFNFKSKVSLDVLKNAIKYEMTSTFSSKMLPQRHMLSSICRFNL